jgi:hypothetical protein
MQVETMGKKRKRVKPLKSRPVYAPGEAEAKGIQSFTRRDAIADILETAIWLWVMEKSPVSMHLLVMSQLQVLRDLTQNKPKGAPFTLSLVYPEQMYRIYHWLRHSSPNPNTGADFTTEVTGGILYDVICSFNELFRGMTVSMQAFLAHWPLWLGQREAGIIQMASYELPKGVTMQDFLTLTRKPFFDKLYWAFREQVAG